MISTLGTRVWTPHGFLFAEDLYVGQKTISFNPERGVCEYDEIKSIQIDYMQCMGYGISSKSMNQLVTPDHPLLMWDFKHKVSNRVSIEDKFMYMLNSEKNIGILAAALFEPYLVTQDPEHIKWTARLCAGVAKYRYAPVPDTPTDLGGYEAQLWLDTFFHWNRMLPAKNWMGTVELNNKGIHDIVCEIAPRAGVGTKTYRLKNKSVISITSNGSVTPHALSGWLKRPIDNLVFNVTTRNGNVLVKRSRGTFLLACNKENNEGTKTTTMQ